MTEFKISTRPGVETVISQEGNRVDVRTRQAIPDSWLSRLHERAVASSGRAPLGDSDGAWQFCGEIPANLAFSKIPLDAWNDQKAWAKLLNDPEIRAFTTGRKF